MAVSGCDLVDTYLDKFLDQDSRSGFDLSRISDHVSECAACYARFTMFFRTMELPESSYLRETLDEMAGALYNLAKAIIRDRPPVSAEDVTENVVITEEGGGSVSDNIQVGEEMIEDAEDYTGSSHVHGTDLEEIRALLEGAESSRMLRLDLALQIFGRATDLDSSHHSKAWNWIEVLHLQKEEFEEAGEAFRRALSAPDGATDVRAKAHCNLGYVYKNLGDLDAALKSARRSVVLAQEDGEDPYFGEFASLYFLLLRAEGDDISAAGEIVSVWIGAGQDGRFKNDLGLEANRVIRATFADSPLGARYPQLLG